MWSRSSVGRQQKVDAMTEFRLEPELADDPPNVLVHLGTYPGDQVQPHAPFA
jgi:hypothetical protein